VPRIAMGSRASDEACGRQSQVLIVEVGAVRGHCRFILPLARRIQVSFVATRTNAREVGSASSSQWR